MNATLRIALAMAGVAFAGQAAAQITFYEREDFQGRSFTTAKQVGNFERFGFNDRASSVMVQHDRWEVCEDARFAGRCAVLRPGRYSSLADMGLNDRVSSVRIVSRNAHVDDGRYAPAPLVSYDARRRNNERLYEADVTSVHAVVGSSGQRCWIEHEQSSDRGSANVPGAIAGALIGGILGHQVGNGRGQDAATAVGAVGGAAIGANVGRDSNRGYGQDVRRCDNASGEAHPAYWDVTYDFRGQEHRVQLNAPPGRTVTVNEQGEPRA
jgi:uncharacterized protein YcfJ